MIYTCISSLYIQSTDLIWFDFFYFSTFVPQDIYKAYKTTEWINMYSWTWVIRPSVINLDIYMYGPVHICSRYRYPVHLFSEQVLGTHAFRLRDQWIVLGTIAFRFVIGTIRRLRSLTTMHYTAQPENLSPNDWQADPGSWRALAAAVC